MKKKSAERRQGILDAAKTMFERVGFEQATMAEIAATAGHSKATLYNYFSSKEQLFFELARLSADRHCEQVFSLLLPNCSGPLMRTLPEQPNEVLGLLHTSDGLRVTLQCFGEGVMRSLLSLKSLAARRMLIAAAANQPDAGRIFYENGPAKSMQLTAQFFDQAMSSGQLRRADPKTMAAHFRGLLESEVYESGLFNARKELQPKEVTATVERAVSVFIRAYALGTRDLPPT